VKGIKHGAKNCTYHIPTKKNSDGFFVT
jgi:hypothetical protein